MSEMAVCNLMSAMAAEESNGIADNFGELNLSSQSLKKISKDLFKNPDITSLVLDNNCLQRLENLDHLTQLICLSAVSNKLVRMYGVARLRSLTRLNLSKNGIVTIEGLKNLNNLHWISLSGNKIKQLEMLSSNLALEFVDLSDNLIQGVSDISLLKNLQVLKLHDNRLTTLKFCTNHLPNSLKAITLSNNQIADLNEVSYISSLPSLESITIANNPCVAMTGMSIGFDYRPFLINWSMSLRLIDDYMVGAKESLQAEWLYSQGKGRQFHIGEQSALIDYLSAVCPLSDEKLSSQDEQKLMLILSKAQQHQRQLWEETSGSVSPARVNSPPRKPSSISSSPSLSHSRLRSTSPRQRSPASRDRHSTIGISNSQLLMSSSYTVALPVTLYAPDTNDLMSTSADAALLGSGGRDALMSRSLDPMMFKESSDPLRPNQLCEPNSPLKAASKLVPVPETIMSPDYRPASTRHIHGSPLQQKPKINGTHLNEIKTSSSTKSVPATLNSSNHMQTGSRISRSAMATRSKSTETAASKATRKYTPNSKTPEPGRTVSIIAKQSPRFRREQHRKDSSDEDSEMSVSKLETIQCLAFERKLKTKPKTFEDLSDDKRESAAVKIQKIWRGYKTRNLNPKVVSLKKDIQSSRHDEYIRSLSKELSTAKAALNTERKLRLLQMEAIKALWREVQGLQSPRTPQTPLPGFSIKSNTESVAVAELTKTCAQLQEQVQQLQSSLEGVVQCITSFSSTSLPGASMPDLHQVQSQPSSLIPWQMTSSAPIPSIPVQVTKEPSPEPVADEESQQPVVTNSNLLDIRHAKSKQRPSYLPIFNSNSVGTDQSLAVEPVKQFAGSFVESLINTAVLKAKLSMNKSLEAPTAEDN